MLDVRESGEVSGDVQTAGSRAAKKATRKPADVKQSKGKGLKFACRMSTKGVSCFDEIKWERRTTTITDGKGNSIFRQDDVEVPSAWSMLAANVVASKYFYGAQESDDREDSVRQLVHRVSRTVADWGLNAGYFASAEDAENFYADLSYLTVNQYGSFNSPVWFNVGLYQVYGHTSNSRTSYCWDEEEQRIVKTMNSYKHPQASACFIQSVDDTMEDIMRLASSEAMLFKYGSGTGTDLSTLRSSREKLSGGGSPSGPLSFMRVFDQVAAVIKSGGKTRRAAKMQSLKIHHPDILDFIQCKTKEERKAWALIEQGYDGSFGGEAYESVMFQNANLSIRLTDEFMQAVENDGPWHTTAILTGEKIEKHNARDLLKAIAEGTHICGDPGVQYDTTINEWHTCKESGPINASNPCSEYMFLDDSACNLASLNLMKFTDDAGVFDVDTFKHAVRTFIIAQDILIDAASYPSDEIATNSHNYRPLGLGYANLGALIMRLGMAYDSEDGRAFAGAVTATMTGNAYLTSQELAKAKGTFDKYDENKKCMMDVMKMHKEQLGSIDSALCPPNLRKAAEQAWEQVVETGSKTGFRNAQVTVLAPTGTIGFMMDCDTTGVEPDIALVKYKQLAGGGLMKIVNRTLRPALTKLGYTHEQVEAIVKHVDENDTIEGAPELKPEDLHIFDCAFKAKNGKRFISYKAHLKMMSAVQSFLSGAISKTVNVPTETSVNEIVQVYTEGWKMGLKAIAVYRDGSKRTQPLNTSDVGAEKDAADAAKKAEEEKVAQPQPFRRRMPLTRQSITHKFEVAGHEGYLTVGMYEDGSPGELFITMAKEGSTVGGTMDAFGTAISLCLQYGVSVSELSKKFAHSRFEPSGFTKNPDIPMAKSIVDYIFRWLAITFPNGTARNFIPTEHQEAHARAYASIGNKDTLTAAPAPVPEPVVQDGMPAEMVVGNRVDDQFAHYQEDAPACDQCGAITVRNGACYRCYNCGNSMGCS
jgi:ribonucleoside-diphosphate reductase alpha chain